MRIAVKTTTQTYYLNFDLIVDFSFVSTGKGDFYFIYSTGTEDDNYQKIIISEEEKNRILNKLDLL